MQPSRFMDSGAGPYEIRERVFRFAVDVLSSRPGRQEAFDRAVVNAWAQLTAAATSAGANLEEAEAASSRADFIARSRIVLRELRESAYWLRVIHAARLGGADAAASLLPEARELVAIMTTIVKNASRGATKPR